MKKKCCIVVLVVVHHVFYSNIFIISLKNYHLFGHNNNYFVLRK
jgi:hypothetical protein